jgi:hypothetical protein
MSSPHDGQIGRGCANQDRNLFHVCLQAHDLRIWKLKPEANFTFGHATEKLIVGYRTPKWIILGTSKKALLHTKALALLDLPR